MDYCDSFRVWAHEIICRNGSLTFIPYLLVAVKLTSNNSLYGHSIDTVASHYEEEEQVESMDDIEAHMIGNLLPDDDELLSGVTDGLEFSLPFKGGDEMEELDLFNSIGGMDLEEDGPSDGQKRFRNTGDGNSSMNGGHRRGEHPCRALFVRNISSNVEDSELRALFEVCSFPLSLLCPFFQ